MKLEITTALVVGGDRTDVAASQVSAEIAITASPIGGDPTDVAAPEVCAKKIAITMPPVVDVSVASQQPYGVELKIKISCLSTGLQLP